MIIYPAIDIKDGRCVRLIQGDALKKTDYGDPLDMAARWRDLGTEWLHIVDLDGAMDSGGNLSVVERIAASGIKIQLGGGIRSFEHVKRRLDIGITRVILGTAAVENRELVREAAIAYPGRIVVGLDSMNGFVRTRGWSGESQITPAELALEMTRLGADIFLYTDISRDGMLMGPDVEGTAALCGLGLNIIGSGGVGSVEDIIQLKNAGCSGVIVGKALYEGKVELGEAIRLAGLAPRI